MKLCQKCGQSLAEQIGVCPACGNEVGEGRKFIDDYRIITVVHEGYASFLCKAIRERTNERVMIRLFTPQSGVDEEVAARLRRELEQLKKLPAKGFVQHYAIRQSEDGLWYRISEWIDVLNWGELLRSGRLKDYQVAFTLFAKIASILEVLHESGHIVPHLILDDIILIEDENDELDVKIDYKFSRFFDPKMDQPGPMLKHLLDTHPDIIHNRPLDPRSDIWSLGKVFVELLTTDYNITDYLAKVDELPLTEEAKVLFKTMLADDPVLRPTSTREVSESLFQIAKSDQEAPPKTENDLSEASSTAIRRLRRRQRWLIAMVVLLIVGVGVAVFNRNVFWEKGNTVVLEDYANEFASSVAFILVDYWVKEGDTYVYRNRSEGTSFLVDADGYLLTNRHVACPWLEDPNLHTAAMQMKMAGRTPQFGFSLYLWFEGAKAFNRSAGLMDSPDLADLYFLDAAFRSDGTPKLSIAGVARSPILTRQLVSSPLREDFAVLKIDKLPEGLKPFPLEDKLDVLNIPKLSPIISLGFPLGSRTQEAFVNVSVTRGHVRRTFENLIQIDASIYGGNSGGPMLDLDGKVIGIISGVATDRAPGFIPMVTPLWDMGMVLPITPAISFLSDLKAGKPKWNGVLDLSVAEKLEKIFEPATDARWAEAMAAADKELKASTDPQLVMAGGMMHFCADDHGGARNYFGQSLSMDPENRIAQLMLFLIDWSEDRAEKSEHRKELLSLDWRSPAEFQGYLTRVMEGMVEPESALETWDTLSEKSWIYYIVGIIKAKQEKLKPAEKVLKEAVIAADPSSWEFFLASAQLEKVQQKILSSFQMQAGWDEYQKDMAVFQKSILDALPKKKEKQDKLVQLKTQLMASEMALSQKRQIFTQLHEHSPDNGQTLVGLAFYSAAEEDWPNALDYARSYLLKNGRQNAGRLSIGLMEAEILHIMGKKVEAEASLKIYYQRTQDPWYRAISENLMGKRTLDSLKKEAGNRPENLVVLHAALGFWAEGSGDKEKATEHYRAALESFMDTWIEYDFAKGRINRLRQPSG